MKQVSILLVVLSATLSVQAQYRQHNNRSAVTITINGNNNLQVSIDSRDYRLYSGIVMGNKTTISIPDLESGQHTLQVNRTDQNTGRSEKIATIFNLRRRYDMLIRLNVNGCLELIERLQTRSSFAKSAMSYSDFNYLLNNVRNQRTTTGRRTVISNAFTNINNFFSCSQVIQLLQQVSIENYRLELAKSSYHTITDRDNFNQVYYLLNSQSGRDALEAFVNGYYEDDNYNYDNNIAMPDASFNNLYQTIRQEWPVSAQMNSLTNAFNNSNNYFTTYQASQLIQMMSAESYRLQLAKLSYRSITDRDNFNLIYDLFNSQASRTELENYVNNYYEGSNPVAIAMPDASFNNLYQTIRQQWPVSTQMNSLTNAFNNSNNYFTTYQASQLIQIVSAENYRLQLAKLSYRRITDPGNFSLIYNLLSTQAGKNELAAYVTNYTGGATGYKVAMPDADFDALYQNIQLQFLPGGKMTAITDAFNATNNYFTCSQAKQLIALVSLESNRLQLAKLVYRIITDRGNFNQLYDLLYTQVSRNELEAYVNAYRD